MFMKIISHILLFFFIFFFYLEGRTQDNSIHPQNTRKADYFAKTPPLRDMKVIRASESLSAESDEGIAEIIQEPDFEKRTFMNNPPLDPVLQDYMGKKNIRDISVNAEGVGNLQNVLPPDTEGDVGLDYYLQMVNMSFAVYDKSGGLVFGPVSNATIWQNAPEPWAGSSNGDPIALYDEQAQRWLISELSFPNHPLGPYYEKIAISETSDPTGSWYLYGFQYNYFCDYPKIGVWNDGYYMTTNNNYWDGSQWHFHAVGVSVFERDSMLAGSANANRIFFDLYPDNQTWSVLPADFDGTPPPEGRPELLAYYKEGSPDRIGFFEVETDWADPGNSTLSLSTTLYPAAFTGDLPDGITQPDGAPYLASMSNRLLYRLQYRKFDTYECMVANHTVNRGFGIAGIRWYEFRNYGPGWQIYQQGTYSPDNTHRWMGSIAMDAYGNIALGYSVSDNAIYPSIRFTGRFKDDPPGEMTVTEQEIISGSGVQTNTNHRWGDYSCMSVDPADQTTFWYTQEYYETTGNRSWQTRIAAFNINDYLSLDLSADDDTVCIGNSTFLHAMPAGGSGEYEFSWTSVPAGFSSSLQNPLINPDTTTQYICQLHDGVNTVTDTLIIYTDPCTGINPSPENIPSVLLRPNPSHGKFNIITKNIPGKTLKISLRNLSGQILYEDNLEISLQEKHLTDISSLPSGIYIAEFSSPHYNAAIKLVLW